MGSFGCGWLIEKFGHIKEFTIIGSFGLLIGCYLLSLIGESTHFYVEMFIYLFYGFCVSIPLQFSLVIAQTSAPSACKWINNFIFLYIISKFIYNNLIEIEIIINNIIK